ncbi:hypothetical protein [Microcystis phage Mel-JY01]
MKILVETTLTLGLVFFRDTYGNKDFINEIKSIENCYSVTEKGGLNNWGKLHSFLNMILCETNAVSMFLDFKTDDGSTYTQQMGETISAGYLFEKWFKYTSGKLKQNKLPSNILSINLAYDMQSIHNNDKYNLNICFANSAFKWNTLKSCVFALQIKKHEFEMVMYRCFIQQGINEIYRTEPAFRKIPK